MSSTYSSCSFYTWAEAGSCLLFTRTCTAISGHVQSTPHTTSTHICRNILSQPSLTPSDRCGSSLFRKDGGGHQDDQVTLDGDRCKVLCLGSISEWHRGQT